MLIDADAIVYETNKALIRTGEGFIRECDIRREPIIEAEPVRHGHWIFYRDEDGWNIWYECSLCHKTSLKNTSYCGNCGAKMDGENE